MDFNEFLLMMKKQMQARDVETEMREAFRVFDRNGDGHIRRERLSFYLIVFLNLPDQLSSVIMSNGAQP